MSRELVRTQANVRWLDEIQLHSSVTSVDVDPDALEIARENVASVEMEEHIEFVHAQIAASGSQPTSPDIPVFDAAKAGRKYDTVVMK